MRSHFPLAHQSRCACAVRGIVIPICRNARWENDEQSHALGPFAPNTYGFPICVIAHAMTGRTFTATLVSVDATFVQPVEPPPRAATIRAASSIRCAYLAGNADRCTA